MNFLSPWALLWLGSLPVLVWLWRFAATKRQTKVASLIPFESLLRRPPTRRSRPPLSLLFWLQALVCALAAWALAEPVVVGRTTHTTLIVLDTSASMGAVRRGTSALDQVKRRVTSYLAGKPPTERVCLVTSAPVQVLTPAPLTDAGELAALLDPVRGSDMAGQLSVAAKVGEAVLGGPPDALLVLTDEPSPSAASALPGSVSFRSVGAPAPNAAIVGLESDEPLCRPAPPGSPLSGAGSAGSGGLAPVSDDASQAATATVRVTVQNFASQPQPITVDVTRERRRVARRRVTVGAGERMLVTLPLADAAPGRYEVQLSAPHDALAVDNRATVSLEAAGERRVQVASRDPDFIRTVGRWLDACPRLSWEAVDPEAAQQDRAAADALLITDDAPTAGRAAGSSLLLPPAAPNVPRRLVYWVANPAHVLSRYLDGAQPVAMTLGPASAAGPLSGVPVVWGIAEGERVPLLSASEEQGRRLVTLRVDPRSSPDEVPVIVAFFNSVQWLARAAESSTTGAPLLVGPLPSGDVRVERPDGRTILAQHAGGVLRYDQTDRAGVYRFHHASGVAERTVNFLDPVESNTFSVGSTWDAPSAAPRPAAARVPVRQPLAAWLIIAMLIALVVEWICYVARSARRSRG